MDARNPHTIIEVDEAPETDAQRSVAREVAAKHIDREWRAQEKREGRWNDWVEPSSGPAPDARVVEARRDACLAWRRAGSPNHWDQRSPHAHLSGAERALAEKEAYRNWRLAEKAQGRWDADIEPRTWPAPDADKGR